MSVLDQIGKTPLVFVDDIYVKLECSNPGGSVKDRIAKFILEKAAERGELNPGDTVVEATSGNTGIALSMVSRELGYKTIIFMPEHMSVERRQMLESLGAELRLTPREKGFEGPIEERNTFRGRAGYYVPDQFGNPDNTLCHKVTTGRELIGQLRENGCDKIDVFVAGVGTGGTLMGVAGALRAVTPGVQIAAVEPEESDVLSGGSPGEHGIQGIGDGFVPDLVEMDVIDEVVCVSTVEARKSSELIRSRHDYCVGLSAGANMAAAACFRDRGLKAATVWPDCSDRYLSLGLGPPSLEEVTCPLRSACAHRGMAAG